MSLRARKIDGVPEETARVARAAFPKGSLAMRVRDKLGELFSDGDFAELYSSRGKLAWSPGRLALVPVMQFAESMSDRQAADAVCGRLDWKYLLGLESTDPGFDHSVLTEFRDRLITANGGIQLLDRVLEAAAETGLSRSARVRCGGVGCPLYPEDGGVLPIGLGGVRRIAVGTAPGRDGSMAGKSYVPLRVNLLLSVAKRGRRPNTVIKANTRLLFWLGHLCL